MRTRRTQLMKALEKRDLKNTIAALRVYIGAKSKNEAIRIKVWRRRSSVSATPTMWQRGHRAMQEANLHGVIIKGWQDRDRNGRVYDESERRSASRRKTLF